MRQKSETQGTSEQVVKDIRRATRKQYWAEEKIRIVLDGLRGDYSIAELCKRKGIAERLCQAARPRTEQFYVRRLTSRAHYFKILFRL